MAPRRESLFPEFFAMLDRPIPALPLALFLCSPAALAQFSPPITIDDSYPYPNDLRAADIDGDGDLDVLATSDGSLPSWYPNLGGGTFGARRAFPSDPADPILGGQGITAADVDLDGDLDVVASTVHPVGVWDEERRVEWFENLGNGQFSLPQIIVSSMTFPVTSVTAADLDGDGLPDFVYTRGGWVPPSLQWVRNLGNGAFAGPVGLDSADLGPKDASCVDLDGDGDLDILTALCNAGIVAWYENLGGGSFGPRRTLDQNADTAWNALAADLDGDGDLDVVTAPHDTDSIRRYENLGGGQFAPGVDLAVIPLHGASIVEAADIDGDADVDLLAIKIGHGIQPDEIVSLENLGGGTFGAPQPLGGTIGSAERLRVADLDGDHDPDALTYGWLEHSIYWQRNDRAHPGTVDCSGDGSTIPCPCGNAGGPGEGCLTSSGSGVWLDSSGVPDVANDSLVVLAGGGPVNQPALLFQGTTSIAIPFGDGIRCVGGQVRRIAIHTLDSGGGTTFEGLAAHATAGALLRYQLWFRDPQGPCGGGFNLSSALSVTW